jgi:hypothetical protein
MSDLGETIKNHLKTGGRETRGSVFEGVFGKDGAFNRATEHKVDLDALVKFNSSGGLSGGDHSSTFEKINGLVEGLNDMRDGMNHMPEGRAKELRQKQIDSLEKQVQREANSLSRPYKEISGLIAKESEAIYTDVAEFQTLLTDAMIEAKAELRTASEADKLDKKKLLGEGEGKLSTEQLTVELEKIDKNLQKDISRVETNLNGLKDAAINHRDTVLQNNAEVTEGLEGVAKKVKEATTVDIKAGAEKFANAATEATKAAEGWFKVDTAKGFGEKVMKEGKEVGNLKKLPAFAAVAGATLLGSWALGAFKSKHPDYDAGMARGA